MPLVTAGAIARPVLLREEVPVPELGEGAAVCVRGLLQSEKVAVGAVMAGLAKEITAEQRLALITPHLLAVAVVGADDRPVLDVLGWDTFMGRHQAAAVALFNKAYELADFGGEQAEKNS